jgi:hypothetical protein
MEQEAFAFITEQGYSLVKGFFDHDDRGRELNQSFSINFGDGYQDMSQVYFGYKDFNAFLQSSKSVPNRPGFQLFLVGHHSLRWAKKLLPYLALIGYQQLKKTVSERHSVFVL